MKINDEELRELIVAHIYKVRRDPKRTDPYVWEQIPDDFAGLVHRDVVRGLVRFHIKNTGLQRTNSARLSGSSNAYVVERGLNDRESIFSRYLEFEGSLRDFFSQNWS